METFTGTSPGADCLAEGGNKRTGLGHENSFEFAFSVLLGVQTDVLADGAVLALCWPVTCWAGT